MTEETPLPVRMAGALTDTLGQAVQRLARLGLAAGCREHKGIARLVTRSHEQLLDKAGEGRAIGDRALAALGLGHADLEDARLDGTVDADRATLDVDVAPLERARFLLPDAGLCRQPHHRAMRQAFLVQLGEDRLDDTRLDERRDLVLDLLLLDDELGTGQRVRLDPATVLAVAQEVLGMDEPGLDAGRLVIRAHGLELVEDQRLEIVLYIRAEHRLEIEPAKRHAIDPQVADLAVDHALDVVAAGRRYLAALDAAFLLCQEHLDRGIAVDLLALWLIDNAEGVLRDQALGFGDSLCLGGKVTVPDREAHARCVDYPVIAILFYFQRGHFLLLANTYNQDI